MQIPGGELLFVDTNVLLGATDEGRSTHRACTQVIGASNQHGWRLVTNGQVFREYMVVATRPLDQNGLGLTSPQALSNLREFQRFVTLLEPQSGQWACLERLIENAALAGKRIHDANIVAAMLTHGVDHLATDNPDDFAGVGSINAWTSAALSRELAG